MRKPDETYSIAWSKSMCSASSYADRVALLHLLINYTNTLLILQFNFTQLTCLLDQFSRKIAIFMSHSMVLKHHKIHCKPLVTKQAVNTDLWLEVTDWQPFGFLLQHLLVILLSSLFVLQVQPQLHVFIGLPLPPSSHLQQQIYENALSYDNSQGSNHGSETGPVKQNDTELQRTETRMIRWC